MKKRMIALCLAIACILTTLAACNGGTAQTSDPPSGVTDETGELRTVVYGLDSSWNYLNPFQRTGIVILAVNGMIYDRLVYYNGEEYAMRAAESVEVSDDMTEYTIKLKENNWHDGTPVTAEDWVWTLEMITDPNLPLSGMAVKTQFSVLAGTDDVGSRIEGEYFGAEVLDELTFKLTLKEGTNPDDFWTINNNYIYVLPRHLLEDVDPADIATCDFWHNPVGSGPMKFVSESAGQELVLETNEDYYYDIEFDRLVYRVMDKSAFPSALMSGDIDVCYSALDASVANELNGTNGIHITKLETTTTNVMLSINNQRFSKEVRQAFSMLIDRDQIVEDNQAGYAVVTNSQINPYLPYSAPQPYEYNPEKARELLESVGFDFDATYTIGASNTSRKEWATLLQASFAEAGVKLEVVEGDSTSLQDSILNGDLDMSFLTITTNASPVAMMQIYLPNSANNTSLVEDMQFYNALTEITHTFDMDERITLTENLQELWADELPYINLFHQEMYMTMTGKIDNIVAPNCEAVWTWHYNG